MNQEEPLRVGCECGVRRRRLCEIVTRLQRRRSYTNASAKTAVAKKGGQTRGTNTCRIEKHLLSDSFENKRTPLPREKHPGSGSARTPAKGRGLVAFASNGEPLALQYLLHQRLISL